MTAEVLIEHGDRLAFRRYLLRQAVYQDIALPLRRGLHREAAAALLAYMRRLCERSLTSR